MRNTGRRDSATPVEPWTTEAGLLDHRWQRCAVPESNGRPFPVEDTGMDHAVIAGRIHLVAFVLGLVLAGGCGSSGGDGPTGGAVSGPADTHCAGVAAVGGVST